VWVDGCNITWISSLETLLSCLSQLICLESREVMHIIHQLSKLLGPKYRNLVGRIRKAEARYIDETS